MRRSYQEAMPQENLITWIGLNNLKEVKHILKTKSDDFDLNQKDINGDTPLIFAAKKALKEMVVVLLGAGADPYIKYVEGALPSEIKNENDSNEEIADLLLINNKELPDGQEWFFKERLPYINCFTNPEPGDAACYAISYLGMHAIFNKLGLFKLRLQLIYAISPGQAYAKKIQEIENERIKIIQTIQELEKSKININLFNAREKQAWYNHIRLQALKSIPSLVNRAFHAVEIPIFSENMVLYQKTNDYKFLFPEKIFNQNANVVLPLVMPLNLGSVILIDSFTENCTKNEIYESLQILNEIINQDPICNYPFSLSLANINHRIQIGYDPDIGWIFINASKLKRICFPKDDMADNIFNAFCKYSENRSNFSRNLFIPIHSNYIPPQKNIIFSTQVYVETKYEHLLRKKIQLWHNHPKMKEIRLVNEEKATKTDDYQATWLTIAAKQGDLPTANALLEHKALINHAVSGGKTALYIAACNGHHSVVVALIQLGAAVNQADDFNKTPLYIAAMNGHLEIVQTLLDHGATVNEADNFNITPLFVAAQMGQLDIVRILFQHGAKQVINQAKFQGPTPLCIAAYNNHFSVVVELLQNGAVVNQSDHVGITPLFAAAQNGHYDIVTLLCEYQADISIAFKTNVNFLHNFAKRNNVTASLTDYFKLNAIDEHDKLKEIFITPMDIAKIMKKIKIYTYLESLSSQLPLNNTNTFNPILRIY